VLTVPRVASIAGRVVDPSGKPVVGATIRLRDRTFSIRLEADPPPPIRTDATGAFRVDRLVPGTRFVGASSPDWADSAESTLELAPGTTRSDLLLTLRVGGTIVGEVVDAAGKPRVGGTIVASPTSMEAMRGVSPRTVKVDDKGGFRFERLVPGRYELERKDADKPSLGLSLDDLDALVNEPLPTDKSSVRIVVVDGETTRVVLGRQAESAMTGRGRVTFGGKPAAGIEVIATKMYDNETFEQNRATTGDDGSFRIDLDEPGTHYFELDLGPVQHLCTRVVGEEREQTFDFEYGVSRIVGRVVNADGKPMAAVDMRLASSATSSNYDSFNTTGTAQTDAEGRFVFERLPRATYRIDAGEATDGARGVAPSFGQATRDGVVVTANGDVEVEIRPTRPCTITGRVVDAQGKPVADLAVFARGKNGAILSRGKLASTDRDGSFRVTGLPAEAISVFARDHARATPESAPIALDPERAASIALVASPGTRLWIHAQSENKRFLTRYQVRVFDAQGRDVALPTWRDQPDDGEPGELESVLPPGSYRVVVRQRGRQDAEATIDVAGEAHVSRVLTLPRNP